MVRREVCMEKEEEKEKVIAEIFLSEDVWLGPVVTELEHCRRVKPVLARLGSHVRKIGYVRAEP